MKPVKVRAFYRAVQVDGRPAPFDNISLKVYYPCQYGDSFEERNTGFVPADTTLAPLPVVIIMPGINVSHESYSWLARKIARAGFAVITYSWIAEEMPGLVSVTPGLSINDLMQENYGQQASCPALPALLKEIQALNAEGLLAGLLDTRRIILGGHSAGGTMALLNADPRWCPGVCGAFSYAAHTAANVQLGWPEDSMIPLNPELPMLILGGNRDGVIAASSHRYGDDADSNPCERIERTFTEAITGSGGERHLVIIEGANHFAMVRPLDTSTGRPFLDWPTQGKPGQIRKYMSALIIQFCQRATARPDHLAELVSDQHPLGAVAASK